MRVFNDSCALWLWELEGVREVWGALRVTGRVGDLKANTRCRGRWETSGKKGLPLALGKARYGQVTVL